MLVKSVCVCVCVCVCVFVCVCIGAMAAVAASAYIFLWQDYIPLPFNLLPSFTRDTSEILDPSPSEVALAKADYNDVTDKPANTTATAQRPIAG